MSPIGLVSRKINVEIEEISNKIALLKHIKEIEYLKSDNFRLKNELYDHRQIQTEMNDIKKLKRDHFYFIDTINVSSVIKNSEEYFIGQYFGATDININDLVLNQDNFLVGRVIAVNKDLKIAKIQLAEDKYFLIPVYGNETKHTGILNNNKKFSSCSLEFTIIDNKNLLNEGELVLTSPEDGLITSNIKIGYIKKKYNQNCIERNVSLIKDKLFVVRNILATSKLE